MQIRHVFRAIGLLFSSFVLLQPFANAQSPSGVPDNYLILPPKTFSIPFIWQADTINSKREEHTAMLLPVKLKHCPRLFYMQFDLGSPYSMFYGNKVEAIRARYPKTIQEEDSIAVLRDFAFKIGKTEVTARQIEVKQFDSTTVDWEDQKSFEIIGTIGADLIDGRIVVMDYPQKRITISQTLSRELNKKISLTDFIYTQRRILLPAKIMNKPTLLYFDTGSSLYELLTDKKTAELLADADGEVHQSQVKSWDKYLTANTISTPDSVEIAGSKLPIRRVTYITGVSNSQVEQMMKMGIAGMTGNTLFLSCKLVLDTKNKKFGLIQSN